MATLSTEFVNLGQAASEKTGIVGRLVNKLAESVVAARTYNELNALTDAQLRDIGIYRNDIARVAFGKNK
ncbi:DUF1127 domain-containing protein [Curvivirga sp.]|uniref:DUF1127 domain-containing protein n=1 Tax=Curvivirga sp. TaxID=2856848 RepID=UPI003B5C55F1